MFGLLGDTALRESTDFAAVADANARMRAAYAAQKWDETNAALTELETAGEAAGLDLTGYAALYHGRLEDFAAAPPGPDWDGVFVATSK